jgi:DNA mismatch repair protein MLH1
MSIDLLKMTDLIFFTMQRIIESIMARRDMLHEYFLLEINEIGSVVSLPHLLTGYTPNLDKLPLFLMRLGPQVYVKLRSLPSCVDARLQVNWDSEKECFESFLRELAYFYVPEPLVPDSTKVDAENEHALRWQIQHLLFPAMAKYLQPPKSLLDRDVVQVAHLPELYKVFERC